MNTALHYIRLIFIAMLFLLLNACNPAKKLKEGEYLLNRYNIQGNIANIDKSELESYVKPKPNYRLLGLTRFQLWVYNLANEENIKRKQILYAERLKKRNEARIAKGKKEKKSHPHIFGEWLLKIGEAPVVYDSLLVKKSAKQIKFYLNNKGYFLSTVKDSVHHKNKKKVNVYYNITLRSAYKINSINYDIPDELIKKPVYADTANCLLKKGDNYNLDVIQAERDRIAYNLNNEGYYLFTKEFIYFKIDTISTKGKVTITVEIKNNVKKADNLIDSLLEEPHKRFYINDIYIETDFAALKKDTLTIDTLITGANNEYKIVYSKVLKYKPKVLLDAIYINKNDLYQFKNVEATYKRLSELNAFKYVNIVFKQNATGKLDCYIQLNPTLKQSFTAETELTNSSGSLGVSGSVAYQNKNLLKGAEVFEFRLMGGLSAQRILTEASNTPQFNTIQFGPQLKIYVPRFLSPFDFKSFKPSSPKTVFTAGLDYQNRPDYKRIVTNFSLGYTWRQSSQKRHTFNPFVIDFVKVDLQPGFFALLNNENPFVKYSFNNHITTKSTYSFAFNEQNLNKEKSFSFFKCDLESSGNIFRGLYNLVNEIHPNTLIKNEQGGYTFLNIPFAQYLRADADYRYYLNLKDLGKIVFRVAGGVGVALANFNVLPFESNFFSGGANGLRAWQSRTVGPGSYSNQGFSYSKFGNSQLEANIEHRFKIFKALNGAVFIDAGNVWSSKPDTLRGGTFQLSTFYKEIAIGTGFGLRADFNFFILRLDLGIKVRDPEFAENDRWVLPYLFDRRWVEENHYSFTTLNFGVGYPF